VNIVNEDEKRMHLKELKEIKSRAVKGVETHADHLKMVEIMIKLIKYY
jgi:hypothetical protein